MKKYLSLLLAIAMVCTMLCLPTAATASGYTMTVDESTVIKTANGAIFGLNNDWAITDESFVKDMANHDFSPAIGVKAAFAGTTLPLVRLGEGASQRVFWKDMVGDMNDRPEYTLWGETGIIQLGLVERIKYFQAIDPNVQFIITVNMNDTAQNAGDLAEFLTGGSGTVWGAKRIECGLSDPVNVKMYQLGNENDRGDDAMTASEYVAVAAPIAAAIKAKDANASFGVIGGTAMYTHYYRDGSYDDTWLKAVVSGLKTYTDYVTFNWYFGAASTYKVDNLLDQVKNSIYQAIGNNSVKLCLTEFAESVYGDPPTDPINLQGILTTADFYSRTYFDTTLDFAAYHALSSSSWKSIWFDNSGKCGLTGIGMLQKLFKNYGVGNVLSSTFTGFSKGSTASVTGIAVSPGENRMNLIFTNRTSEDVTVDLNLPGGYMLCNEEVLKSASSTPSLQDVTNATSAQVNSNHYEYATPQAISTYTIPAYSVCAVGFEKTESNAVTLYSEDFSNANMSDFTAIIHTEEDGVGASINNSALLLDGYGEYGSTFVDNYVYLPNDVDSAKEFTLNAKVKVNAFDDGAFGIVYKASQANDFLSAGSGNLITVSGDGVNEKQYSSGTAATLQSNVSANVPDLSGNPTFNIRLAVDRSNISFAINNKVIYSRSNTTLNESGKIGFYFSDLSVSVDDITVTVPEATVTIGKPITYEEDFDTVPDGELPEGFCLTSGQATAYVEDGALYVENRDWWTREGVIIPSVGKLLTQDLVIEADITKISQNDSARGYGALNSGGFIFGADGKDKSTWGAHTYHDYFEFTSPRVTTQMSAYPSGETPFHEGGTVHVKIVCSENESPTVYINGRANPYTKGSATVNESGIVGFYAMAAKIKVDNLCITAKEAQEFAAEDVSEKPVNFTYTEDFNDMANGTLPTGWTLVKGKSTDSAQVVDHALQLKSEDWYSNTYLLFDFDEVMRHYGTTGLTMECDITRLGISGGDGNGNKNNSRAGLLYAVDYDESTGAINSASFVAPYTHKNEGSSAVAVKDFGSISTNPYLGTSNNSLQFNWATREEPVHLRIAFNNTTQSPSVYIDGVQMPYSRHYSDSADRILSGKIGLYAYNTYVSIDNIVVSGIQTVTMPMDVTYEAGFKKASHEYASIEAAEADVLLEEVDYFGNKTDITASADITTVQVNENAYRTTVSYDSDDDGTDDFIEALTWTLIYYDEGFYYSENFDTMANGTLPAGWTLVKGKSTDSAQVVDHALQLKSEDWYSNTYLFFDFDEVLRAGLTMECDITRIGISNGSGNGNKNNSRAGLLYATDYDANTGTVNTANYIAPCTYKAEASSAIMVKDLGEGPAAKPYQNANGSSTLQFNWETRETPVHLKIVAGSNTGKSPDIYIDGEKVFYYNTYASGTTSGKIGLYAYNCYVSIDNIVVSGTQRKDEAENDNSLLAPAYRYDSTNQTLDVKVQGKKTDEADKKLVIAIYAKETDRLIKVISANWGSSYKDIVTDMGVEDLADFSLQTYRVSVFAWEMENLAPVDGRCDLGE